MPSFQSIEAQTLLRSKLLARAQATEDGCWEWTGSRIPAGYGSMKWNGKNHGTHRLAYEAFKGPIPDGMMVRHTCDNPPCINPDHLLVGTGKDNTRDSLERGRFRNSKGEANNLAKLTNEDVVAIRASNELPSVLADKFGIGCTNVWQVRTGKTWKHVDLGEPTPRAPGRPAKLTEDDIRAIRSSELTGKELATIFNVSQATVSMVRTGKYVLTTARGA